MVFKSKYPDIEYPTDLTVWEWAFEDKRYSPMFRNPPSELAGFSNAVTGERLDFLQVKEHATHLCTALTSQHGLRRGDTVSLFSQNSIWYPVAMFAVLRAGGRVNGASPSHTVDEMANALKTADTKFIMTVPQSVDTALAAARKAGIPAERIFLLEGELQGHSSMLQLLETGRARGKDGQTPFFRIAKGQTNDVCGYLNFSSGTTGLPKSVMLSHRNVIAQCLQLGSASGPERRRYLACLPLFHISGLVRFLHWPIASNNECIMLPQFTMENFLKAIQQFKITDLALVPSIVNRLVNDPLVFKYDLTSVKLIACGAAPLGEEVIKLLEKKLPWTGFRQSYGMTETCCCLTTHPPEFYNYKYADSGGVLLASTVIKIVDLDSGRELGPNETGEILAKGPQIAMGYLANPKETAETFGAQGFLHTGDIGCVDDKGFIHIVDRIKEMIKVKGQQVAPADLEQLLLGHPAVEDCAVLGIPDDRSSERPKAFVVLKRTVSPNPTIARELLQYVKDRKIRYKWLKEIEFIPEVPKSPSGKILRRVLRGKRAKEDTFTSYSGETAYITGGASGIGRFLAERLVSKGMKVVVSDRNFEGAEEVAKALNKNGQVAWAAQVDVADWDSQKQAFETAVEKLGRIHYVFPVAGITERLWIPNEPSSDGFVKPDLSVFDINGTGALYTSALATQHFRAQQPNNHGFRGKTIIVSSGCGFYSIPSLPIYSASKHAVVGFVRSYGKFLPEEKITLNAICPCIVRTGISSNEFYDKIEAKGLLTPVETLLGAFEELLGDCTTSGEAIEILPGGGGSKIKERPEYTSEECKISVELAHARSYKAFFGASRATQT